MLIVELGLRQWQRHDVQRSAVLVSHRSQLRQIFSQRQVVDVGSIRCRGGDDGLGTDEPGELVDVAVSVVAGKVSSFEPDHLLCRQVVSVQVLKVLAVPMRIALRVQQSGRCW